MSDEFWTHENKQLGAAIQCMFAACVLLKEQGYDSIKICKVVASGKKLKKIIGRNPYKKKQ